MSPGCKNLLIWFNILIQTYLTIVTKRNNCCNRIVLFIKKKLFLKKSASRNSHPEVFYKKGVLRNFEKFTGKHLCQSLFFNKVAGLRPATLLKKRLWHRRFPVDFAKCLTTSFLTEHLRGLFQYFLRYFYYKTL